MKVKQLKHKWIETELRQLAKTLPSGARLPAERDLAIEYDCNFLTVRKALKALSDDGLIIRRVGSGTFIAPQTESPLSGTGRRENRVGVLVYQNGNAYAFSVIQALAHMAPEENAELRSCWINDFQEAGLRQAATLAEEGCCCLTLPWFPLELTPVLPDFVRRCPLPVSLPALVPGLEPHCFEQTHVYGANTVAVTEALCRYFTRLGHRRIAFLGPNTPGDQVTERQLGAYTRFLSLENLPLVCGLVDTSASAMDQQAERWKAYRNDLAIISYDDEHALRFMTAMHKLGLSAPGDFAIVGYNNVDASHYSDPPLSTVRQNFNYVAHWLLTNALALSRGEVCQSPTGQPLDLLVRATCGGRTHITDALREELRPQKLELCIQSESPLTQDVADEPAADGTLREPAADGLSLLPA